MYKFKSLISCFRIKIFAVLIAKCMINTWPNSKILLFNYLTVILDMPLAFYCTFLAVSGSEKPTSGS